MDREIFYCRCENTAYYRNDEENLTGLRCNQLFQRRWKLSRVLATREENQTPRGRKRIELSIEDEGHIENRLRDNWSLDVIANRYKEDDSLPFPVKASTLYRRAKEGLFKLDLLPMKGKRKPNGYTEKRGKQSLTRNISERVKDHPNVKEEFGHIEGDIIVGAYHKSEVITLAERLTKMIITLKPISRSALSVGQRINE